VFDRFTGDALKAMALSRKEAQRLGHDFIGTEHVLLGLMEIKSVAALLADLDLDSKVVRRNVEERAPPPGDSVPAGALPFTHHAKRVLELSMESAYELGHDYIAPEHILMGVVSEDSGIGGNVLRELGCSPEQVIGLARPTRKLPWWRFW
jgi:ATP-dependent Clp protease ATP-binding subunit ClpC